MITRATRSPRRRTVVALAVVLAVLAGFIVRLVDIQVVHAEREHRRLPRRMHSAARRPCTARRGTIVDDSGQTLAGSVLQYDCQLDPLLITQIDQDILDKKSTAKPWSKVSVKIATITGQDVAARAEDRGRRAGDGPEVALRDARQGPVDRGSTAGSPSSDQPYLVCVQHPARTYPDGAVGGNLVGFMGSDGDAARGPREERRTRASRRPTARRAFERGKDGVVIPGTEREQPAVDGGTLQLTINRDLQWYMQQLIGEQAQDMGAQHGAILVVETGTGKIRAAAEWPSVDPNDVNASSADDRGSRIFRGTFEPGSTFKGITAVDA